MRRGFLSSPPRQRKPTNSAPSPSTTGTRSQPFLASNETTKQDRTTSVSSTSEAIPLPTRYAVLLPSPKYNRDLKLGSSFKFTQVPAEDGPPELSTTFMHCDGMLDALQAQYPGWPQPFCSPPSVYKIAPVPGTGVGLIATADIAPGEVLLRDRPLLAMPCALLFTAASSVQDHLRAMDAAVDAMHPENKRAFYALKNWKGTTAGSEVKGIMDTNGYGIDSYPVWEAMYLTVMRDGSRINHSCRPNVTHTHDVATLTDTMRALEPIRAGEEITISYLIGALKTRDERQAELLRRYGFTCRCKVCRLTGFQHTVHDIARQAIEEGAHPANVRTDEAAFEKWLAQGAPRPPPVANPHSDTTHPFYCTVRAWEMMAVTGCYEMSTYESLLERLVKSFAIMRDEEGVRNCAKRAAELRTAFTGEDGGWRAIAENPRKVEWWGKKPRVSIRA